MPYDQDGNWLDDDLEWWEMPESSIRWLEERKRQTKEKFDAERKIEYERNKIRAEARKRLPEIIARDGEGCQECGSLEHSTVDHIIPLARGGGNDLENLQILCSDCNSRKGAN